MIVFHTFKDVPILAKDPFVCSNVGTEFVPNKLPSLSILKGISICRTENSLIKEKIKDG
jgi:hypothetical protein